jgi:hypothetical protein
VSLKVPRKLAFVAAPVAVLALGAASYGSVVAFAAASPSPPAVTQGPPPAGEPAESTTTAEAPEPNEPTLPGGGHADPDNVQSDTQQEGVN